jgi:16S rRNA (guanine(966)-N(2))-methyltransferase RsmD
LRVIAGSAKGRTLASPKALNVRPTTDRVKGAIFSMVASAVARQAEAAGVDALPIARVLDLYAGTGALGIEALSRGADRCDFVESSAKARSLILENLRRTGFVEQATVHSLNAQSAISTFRVAYDLILADPPYSDPTILALIAALGQSEVIGARSLVVVEHSRSIQMPASAGRLSLARSRYHGTSALALYEVAATMEAA